MLKPDPEPPFTARPVTHQAAKSAATRARIIDAMIRCLVKFGYAHTTTLKVAAEAEVSRGAMMHHFENAAALTYAAAEELHRRRLQAVTDSAREIDHQDTQSIAHRSWEIVKSDNYIAFLELAIAARTDRELAAILQPLNREYYDRGFREALALFPEWESASPEFELAYSLSQVTRLGLFLAITTDSIDAKMAHPILERFAEQIIELRALGKARGGDKDRAGKA